MKLFELLKSFRKDKKGSTALGLGLTFTMVAGATVGAIEIEQMQKARNIMQDKLDATILYLGNSDFKTTPQEAGEAYFTSTIEATDLEITWMEPVFTYEADTGKVIGDVAFKIPSLMSGGLIKDKSLAVKAVATPRVTGKVEIAMVLDVSGSMGWEFTSTNNAAVGSRRIDGLFEAAEEMFDEIYKNPLATPAVAVIPYATSVDITDIFAATPTSGRDSKFSDMWGNRSLSNIGMTVDTDAGYNVGSFMSLSEVTSDHVTERDHKHTMAVWPGERYVQDLSGDDYIVSLDAPTGNRKIPVYTEEYAQIWSHPSYASNYGSEDIKVRKSGNSWYLGGYEKPTMGVMPMTTDTQAVRDYVASFSPSGGTAGHIGAAWGLYALAPEWGGIFNHPAGTPNAWEETTEKYLVIMTDGQFNSQKDSNMSEDEMYGYFQAICKKARDNNVRVFTVGLLLDDNTEQQLQECAGNSGGFYPVDTRLGLVEAFHAVGRETGELRLSQ